LDAADEREHRQEEEDERDEAEQQPEHWRPLSRRTIA
jgi:hypothetical protein